MNVGLLDALIRLALGWLMIHWGIAFKVQLKKGPKLIMSILGTILLLTAVTRYCFIYTLLNISTL
ncbi:DUF2892 domain-containing protein [Coprothermobacteraceae bacterium]|nr:DUF2892 domain-containing protein [Coprothermobacteraceae bacterium]